jgi:hypothetical protein
MNNIKMFVVAIMMSVVFGCSSMGGYVNTAVSRGVELNDGAVTAAEFTLCYGASVGSIRRSFGTPARAKVWTDLCNYTDDFVLSNQSEDLEIFLNK